jgi:hypothetical protein
LDGESNGLMVLRRAWLAAVAVGAVLALVPANTSAERLGRPDFKGTERKGIQLDVKVLFRLVGKGNARRHLVFQARKLQLPCDDQSQMVVTLDPVRVPFQGPRSFRGESYSLEEDGEETLFQVDGRFTSHDRARGGLLYILDAANPPGAGLAPDCSTRGRVFWKAQRVR